MTTKEQADSSPGLPPPYDGGSIRQTIGLLREGENYELRVLGADRKGTVSGYFNDFRVMAKAAAYWSGKGEGVYFTINPVLPDVRARANNRMKEWARSTTTDKEIIHRYRLLIDLDPARPQGISSTVEEHDLALERAGAVYAFLRSQGHHGALCDSGNGGHVLLAIDFPNDAAADKDLQRFLQKLHERFSDDRVKVDIATHNASRLSKFYGTLARKGDNTPDLGRVHRLSRVLEVSHASC